MEKSGRKKYIKQRGMEESPENGKESSHSVRANQLNERMSSVEITASDRCGLLREYYVNPVT
jgi:hypothetical protein